MITPPLQVYYKGDKVQTIFTLPDPTKVDIAVGSNMIRGVNKADLMVSIVDFQAKHNELEKIAEAVKETSELLQRFMKQNPKFNV